MSEDIHEAAARWHMAMARDDMDWDGYTLWLEADPRHREAYDDIALLDARIDRALPLIAANDVEVTESPVPVRRNWIGWGSGIAAALALTIGIATQFSGNPDIPPSIYATTAGKTRTIQLGKGVTATLAANSELRAGERETPMTLKGSAYFDVTHDPGRPVTVRAGEYVIRDVGTRFSISTAPGVIRVAVEQGSVGLSAPGGGETLIAAGQSATVFDGSGKVEVATARAASVSGVRDGRFVYDAAPLALVAADVARFTGKPLVVDPGLARRPFSGVLAPGDRDAMVATLEQLTGLHARKDGETVRLGDRGSD